MYKFMDVPLMDRASLNAAFMSGDVTQICNALVSMSYHEEDVSWAVEKCLFFLEYSDVQISGVAATSLGQVARIHCKLDKMEVIQSLRARACAVPDIVGRIEDALDDINTFVKN